MIACVAALLLATHALADSLTWRTSAATGAIESLRIAGDTTAMEWTLQTDGQQYAWVTAHHGWGLGYFTIDGRQQRWEKPTAVKDATVTYAAGGIEVTVSRRAVGGDMEESYTFRNTLPRAVQLTAIGINTPYNDSRARRPPSRSKRRMARSSCTPQPRSSAQSG